MRYMDGVFEIHGGLFGDRWRVIWRYREGYLEIHGRLFGDTWRLVLRYMEGYFEIHGSGSNPPVYGSAMGE